MKQGLKLEIQGIVQGVGFRPFVYQLATELGLTGWVNNSSAGVSIEVEGDRPILEIFLTRLQQEKPYLSKIQQIQVDWLDVVGYDDFRIKNSIGGNKTALILPDVATCPDCLREIFDPHNRRYLYPFTNCTNCGSRFTIIETLPYDRPNTSMKHFTMCDRCQAEYENPRDRRFHAQPNACTECGPHLELWNRQGAIIASYHDALLATVAAIRQGKIIAIKGLGGFHLVVDAGNKTAVQELRDRKQRPDKPFAFMYPNLASIKADCEVSALEEQLLLSPQAPIVLVKKRLHPASSVVHPPNNPYLGVMLPYTPLHHLLIKELGFPIVATSGNLSGEPICIDNQEALAKVNNIADLFLLHDRPIVRPVDDSIVRIMAGKEQIIRCARGYAPLPYLLSQESKLPSILAVGGQLKNAIAILKEGRIFLSQYIGDLENLSTFERFQQTLTDFQELYELQPTKVTCDRHPHYLATQYAEDLDIPATRIQHHYAHVLSCMADNEINEPESVLGVAWDGTGYGLDGTIWGGEFLTITPTGFERIAHLKPFKLPGGESAIKQPKKIAIALLYEIYGDKLFTDTSYFANLPCIQAFSPQELKIIQTMLAKNLNAPITSSMGRLFDGIAAMMGLCQQITYEGQAAMELEFAIADYYTDAIYNFELIEPVNSSMIINWQPIVKEILRDISQNLSKSEIAAKFHNTLAQIVVAIAQKTERKNILLTGGCWQNKYLTERAIAVLKQENFTPYWHHHIPCNDAGLAVGQIIAAK
ncbi:MAG: carbamoyltransferase HypF [Pleurocapsa sp.]